LARTGVAVLLSALTLLGGCGSTGSRAPSSRELALQRAQFVQLSHGLRSVEAVVQREVAASRRAWPLIADGLPQTLGPRLRDAVEQASASAGALPEPSFAANARKLTGPAAGIAGLYNSYSRLSERGWRLTQTGIAAIGATDPGVTSFERKNSSLYIDAIYDAHFNLSLIGDSITSAYERLGGPSAFGPALTQSNIDALAAAYSIPSVRLQPHPGRAVQDI
jgi:hypothetical protein